MNDLAESGSGFQSKLGRHADPPQPGQRLFRSIVITGFALPWLVGLAVKLGLDVAGRPTWDWSQIFALLPMFLPFSVWFAAPYLLLAWLGRRVVARPRFLGLDPSQRLAAVSSAFACGVAVTILVFLDVFWVFDPIVFFSPLPALYAFFMALGFGVRALSAWASNRRRPAA